MGQGDVVDCKVWNVNVRSDEDSDNIGVCVDSVYVACEDAAHDAQPRRSQQVCRNPSGQTFMALHAHSGGGYAGSACSSRLLDPPVLIGIISL